MRLRRQREPDPSPRKQAGPTEKPDVHKALRTLERVRRQRPDVERLVADLVREQELNNFTASAVIVFRGGK